MIQSCLSVQYKSHQDNMQQKETEYSDNNTNTDTNTHIAIKISMKDFVVLKAFPVQKRWGAYT